MSTSSEEENFYKLDNVVTRSTKCLREVFKNRWKVESGEGWRDEPGYIQNFLGQYCKNILKKALPLQKKILLEGRSSKDWDISLISLVILNFGDGNKYKLQNNAVRQLKDLRNDLAHHKSKRLTQSDYSEKLKTFEQSLQILEVTESEIDKLMEEASSSSSFEDTEGLNVFLENAEKLMKLKDFESALKKYSEAINIPRLSPENLGKVYDKRSACHLSIKDKRACKGKHVDQATLDVEQALKLNKSSWNAHYLKAQCHKAKNNLSEAIRLYEMALAISPVQKQIRQELDSCKLLNITTKSNAHLNRDQLPFSVSDILRDVKGESIRTLTLKNTFKLNGSQKQPVYLGERYYYGLEVTQNYAKALKYFTQADEQEFAEGTYKLGLCHYRGHGVPQNAAKAVEIYKRCAKMDARKRRQFETFSPLGYNNGVCHAENAIGKCYEQGTGVEKSTDQAAFWYRKAMNHGHGAAATNLGVLYLKGDGLPENEKMAEMCWKQGLNFRNTVAAEYLVDYYRHQLEPEMAWIMLNIAREMGHTKFLEMSDEEFSRDLIMFQSDRCRLEEYVTTFEKQHNVDFKGMTFTQRMIRAQQHLDPNGAKINNNSINNTSGGQIQNIGRDVMMEVGLRSIDGSETALEVLKTINGIFELNELLARKTDLSNNYKMRIADLSYECMLSEDHLKMFITNIVKFQSILTELFTETCEEIGEEDMKVRLCYISYTLWPSLKSADDLYAFGILKEGLRRYPDNYGYIRLLIYCLKRRRSYKDALKYVNRALEKFPEKVDLYYLKANVLLKSEGFESSKHIAAFELFLEKAPRDHRFVPEAYYEISFLYMEDFMKHDKANDSDYINSETLQLVEDHFKWGKDAEKDQLPCYQPYGVSDCQLIVEGFLGKLKEKCNPDFNLDDRSVMPWVSQSKSVLERKEYMISPVRKGLILQHRERLRDAMMSLNQNGPPFDERVLPEKVQQNRAKKMGTLSSITLQEMNPTKNRVYMNRIIDLTIIEEPNFYLNSIQLVAEDENGDTTRVYVDRIATENDFMRRLTVGRRLAVINPYMWIRALSGVNGIRVNEYKCIMFLKEVQDMCRFCGEENATRKCSSCKRLYCSRDCQKLDWQLFEHNLICLVVSDNNNDRKSIGY